MINNFDLIRSLMTFEPGLFYWGQVISRRKENPNQAGNSFIISDYFFDDAESWVRRTARMAVECEAHNARGYIHLNRRSYKRVALTSIHRSVGLLMQDDWKAVKKAYRSACGTSTEETHKTWLIDVDDSMMEIPRVVRDNAYAYIPTPNGQHIIVKPFDARLAPNLEFKRDSPTLAYYGKETN